ncbi:MAG: hypothetical protein Q9164_004250, partial [Protoblastenia rupestris]
MVFEIDQSISTPEDFRTDPILAAAADKQYILEHAGPRTIIPSSAAYAPFSTCIPTSTLQKWGQSLLSQSPEKSKHRDTILANRLITDRNLGQIEFYFDVANYSPYYVPEAGKKYATMLMMLQYPFSKGCMHIPPLSSTSKNPGTKKSVRAEDKPLINPQYYLGPGGEIDFQATVACQSFADKICRTEPLSSIIKQRVFPPPPPTTTTTVPDSINPNNTENGHENENEKEDFSPWVRDTTITDWHPMGTCAMGGHQGIKGGVVDARLRVYGTKGLRVCDASIMPLQIAAHLQATVYAIGEKGAQILREDWEEGVNGVNGGMNESNG